MLVISKNNIGYCVSFYSVVCCWTFLWSHFCKKLYIYVLLLVVQKPKVCRNIDIRQCFNESCDKNLLDLKIYTC